MREIYFRTHQRHSGAVEYITLQELADGDHFEFDFESYDWMQYTGLKDKNGKKIYEGDIVVEWEDDMEKVETFVVEWCGEDGYPAFDLKPNHFEETNALSFYAQSCEGFEIEVIGNIYENQDLLTKQN